jgi:hypothetical protein
LEVKAISSFHLTRKLLFAVLLVAILLVSAFAAYIYLQNDSSQATATVKPEPYIGVAYGGNTTAEAKVIIDRVKNYTNLFVLDTGTSSLSRNETAVYEICDYATSSGLSVIINLGYDSVNRNNVSSVNVTAWFWDSNIDDMKANWTARWGDKFLGVYDNDEPGGIQLDGSWRQFFELVGDNLSSVKNQAFQTLDQIEDKLASYKDNGTTLDNYDLEAHFFNQVLAADLGLAKLNKANITTFTSDYGLYWWDYLGGYNVMLAELGWNASVAQQIDQVKGAARLQDKDWGTMITWKYDEVPFLDSAKSIYDQMLASYQAGAKYIIIFDYAKDKDGRNTAEAMTDQHYMALYQFWQDIHSKQYEDNSGAVAALVLPHNYGWGMRNPNDTIWGFWPTDEKTDLIANNMYKLLVEYGTKLDIVYEDPAYPVAAAHYKAVYYWNQTIS